MTRRWARAVMVVIFALCLSPMAAWAAGVLRVGPGPTPNVVASSRSRVSTIQCSKNVKSPLYLLDVFNLRRVTVADACAVWSATLTSGRPTKCVGKPFKGYAVVVRHHFDGWRISLVDVKPGGFDAIRFSRAGASFDAGGQDAPPYPCASPRSP
jgi:hypothetical protein